MGAIHQRCLGLLALVLLSSSQTLAQVRRPPEIEFLESEARRQLRLPASEAVRVDGLVYVSGVVGVRPGTLELVSGGIVPETRQTMETMRETLERFGSSMDRVVKCTVVLADIADWRSMNEVYVTFFSQARPARTSFAASGLPLGARVEIDCIAAVKS